MALIAPTQWNRVTLMKAMALVVSDAVPGPEGSFRKVRLVLRNGIASFRILEQGYDANWEIAASRTYEWSEAEAGTQIPPFTLMPNQVLWGMASNTLAQAPGLAHCSVVIEFHGADR
jgi:hypothetical protein